MRAETDPQTVERLRQTSYGQAKKILLETQLQLEQRAAMAVSIAAGRCEQCPACTRPSGLPCRKPERCRWSFSALGFDLSAMAKELTGISLQWSAVGLPAYDTALAAVCTAGNRRNHCAGKSVLPMG